MPLYDIVRFYDPRLRRESEVIKAGVTLEEAQAHCGDPATSKKGRYFDGYREQGRAETPGAAERILEASRRLGL